MTNRKDLRRGTLELEEIAADASWLEHVERVRESGRRYRPASHGNRPALSERPSVPGKVRRTPEQLKLDLRSAHLAVLSGQSSFHKSRAIFSAGVAGSISSALMARSTRFTP